MHVRAAAMGARRTFSRKFEVDQGANNADARGDSVRAPIPIEDIIEKHVKIGLEFDDMHRLIGGHGNNS
jgi:hypothetical protein